VAYGLRAFGFAAGMSRHLIERIAEWGDAEVAALAWREAHAVVAHRLPLAPERGWFARFDPEDRRYPPPRAAAKNVDIGDLGGVALGAWRSMRTRSTMPCWRCYA
jgi:hypothetical protein